MDRVEPAKHGNTNSCKMLVTIYGALREWGHLAHATADRDGVKNTTVVCYITCHGRCRARQTREHEIMQYAGRTLRRVERMGPASSCNWRPSRRKKYHRSFFSCVSWTVSNPPKTGRRNQARCWPSKYGELREWGQLAHATAGRHGVKNTTVAFRITCHGPCRTRQTREDEIMQYAGQK